MVFSIQSKMWTFGRYLFSCWDFNHGILKSIWLFGLLTESSWWSKSDYKVLIWKSQSFTLILSWSWYCLPPVGYNTGSLRQGYDRRGFLQLDIWKYFKADSCHKIPCKWFLLVSWSWGLGQSSNKILVTTTSKYTIRPSASTCLWRSNMNLDLVQFD